MRKHDPDQLLDDRRIRRRQADRPGHGRSQGDGLRRTGVDVWRGLLRAGISEAAVQQDPSVELAGSSSASRPWPAAVFGSIRCRILVPAVAARRLRLRRRISPRGARRRRQGGAGRSRRRGRALGRQRSRSCRTMAWKTRHGLLAGTLPVARQMKVKLGLENVWNWFLTDPMAMRLFVDQFRSRQIGVYFDVGNCLINGYPEHWIEILGRRIVAVHVKNFSRQDCGGGLHGFGDDLLRATSTGRRCLRPLRKSNTAGRSRPKMLPFRVCRPGVARHGIGAEDGRRASDASETTITRKCHGRDVRIRLVATSARSICTRSRSCFGVRCNTC